MNTKYDILYIITDKIDEKFWYGARIGSPAASA